MTPPGIGDERAGRSLGRPTECRVRILTGAVAGVAMAVLLTACGGPSRDVPGEDFAAPPVEPIAVDGLDRCVGLEREGSVGKDPDRLPPVELPCLNEARPVDASRLAGPAVVNLWASWCGPCRKEMPMLAEAARRNPAVRFLGINTQDRPEAAADFLARTGVTYPQLVDIDGLVLADTRVRGLPVTLALDADGRVVERVIGEISEAELSTLLDSLTEPD
ncbi:TlpA family protein disulfide reductase [Nocardioides sp. PD653-B2]|uniref:TlpA family protein disulfide reductase n=1 Tax=Nocardioides sp. PD653-B2 TaxID=1892811 RepID=UPI0009EFF85A|nr:TlpA disulfide reductase family protein [Nocardioides sp. PD653-B2]GAW49731.1 redoxin domain-containing protein [Nocardioides sp. PD653-B2]GAW56529.1 redoxin domain-containing protein [Nocardioides sp. PD653]